MKNKRIISCYMARIIISAMTALVAAYCLPITNCALYGAFNDSGWGVRPLGMAGALAIVISFLTSLTLPTSLAYSVVSSFSAMLEASPCKVTIPFFVYTVVPVALTL